MWYLSAYPKGIQDVGVFFSSVDPILMFLGQTVLVCQSYNGRYRSLSLRGKKNMHREIKIKHFPIVTTHWWPKTRNERFVWENEQYLYRFLPLVHNHVQVIWVRTHPVCDVCVRALWLIGVNAWRRACLKRGADATFQAPTEASANQIASCKYPIQFMQHQRSMWLVVVTMTARQHHGSDTPSVKRWRRRARARAHTRHTHTSHTGCVCALRSLGHGCVQEVKNYINTVRFLTQTARFVS